MMHHAIHTGKSNSDKTSPMSAAYEEESDASNIAIALRKISDAHPSISTGSASEQVRISHVQLDKETPDSELTADGVYNHLNEVDKSPRRRFEGAVFCLPEISGECRGDRKPKHSATRFQISDNVESEYSRLQS